MKFEAELVWVRNEENGKDQARMAVAERTKVALVSERD